MYAAPVVMCMIRQKAMRTVVLIPAQHLRTFRKIGPVFINRQKQIRRKNMDKYVCGPCGYVYDPAEGDADGGIDPGTAFEDLPEDWVCPVCGAAKDEFEKE
eukprot:Anaeramoba_flamelloidesc698_g1_i1.p2 GENE.c698_g1_i1~~c698_g1_i1.p2  ORF type:complete len:101 (-),score=5.43 c698_g1_i1:6-308(-)